MSIGAMIDQVSSPTAVASRSRPGVLGAGTGYGTLSCRCHAPRAESKGLVTKQKMSMQDVILRLQEYWASAGCVVFQPVNTEVGAGTANPATALRVLGPEPWNVAYVEPSVRPDDSRYGLNPNRLQTHTQFQVILKPEPGDPQELYLGSLEAIGIDLDAHDVRFVEDNWASPALGAWGLGWEVWLDGMEITQFTYFQQLGGINLSPVPVEITYGLERIVMALQDVAHFKDVRYSDELSYGEVFGQTEYEMSRYYLDDASVDHVRSLFEVYSAEAQRLLDVRLPIPAYNYALKCSHAFNILDARGAISTTERTKAFSTMRTLVRNVAQLWVEKRAELDHPLGLADTPAPVAETKQGDTTRTTPNETGVPASSSEALLEIGVEELPVSEVLDATDRLDKQLRSSLAETRLAYEDLAVYCTPRRVAVRVWGVAAEEETVQRQVRGPRWGAAFDEAGEPSRALQGFLKKHGSSVADVSKTSHKGADYVSLSITSVGRDSQQVLSEVFTRLIENLRSSTNIRWSDPGLTYIRPIRWVLALVGTTVLDIHVSNLRSGNTTRLLRRSEPCEASVASPAEYVSRLGDAGIVLDRRERRSMVVDRARELAESVGGSIDEVAESALLDEIADLVECPVVLMGSFEQNYLEVPEQVLVGVMKKHQRYLPIRKDGQLTNHFVFVVNGSADEAVVRAGNEAVLRARFEDALFFWRSDLETSPSEFRAELSQLLFEERLGSYLDRSQRIESLANAIAEQLDLSSEDKATIRQAGAVAKFDYASQLVIELPGLAGTMAKEYARRAGFAEEVCVALEEIEQPRAAGAALPSSLPGAVLALADRLDTLTALTSIGVSATGSSDPFGIRRMSSGVISLLRAFPTLDVTFDSGVDRAIGTLREHGATLDDSVQHSVVDILRKRYEHHVIAEDHQAAVVRAVTNGSAVSHPRTGDTVLATLEAWMNSASFDSSFEAIQRIVRILPEQVQPFVDDFEGGAKAEIALAEAFRDFSKQLSPDSELKDYLDLFPTLVPAIERFFEDVKVMDDDQDVRARRLGLLSAIVDHPRRVLDFHALIHGSGQ